MAVSEKLIRAREQIAARRAETREMQIAFAVSMARTANQRRRETGDDRYVTMRQQWMSAARQLRAEG